MHTIHKHLIYLPMLLALGACDSSPEVPPALTPPAADEQESSGEETASSDEGEIEGEHEPAEPATPEPGTDAVPEHPIWGAWDAGADLAAVQGTWNAPDDAVWTFDGSSGTVETSGEVTAVEFEFRSPVTLTITTVESASSVTHSFARNESSIWAGRGRSARLIGDRVVVYQGRYHLVFADGACTAYQLRFGDWSAADSAEFQCERTDEGFRYGEVADDGVRWGNDLSFDGEAGLDVQLTRAALERVDTAGDGSGITP
jgi:hypothetical protein